MKEPLMKTHGARFEFCVYKNESRVFRLVCVRILYSYHVRKLNKENYCGTVICKKSLQAQNALSIRKKSVHDYFSKRRVFGVVFTCPAVTGGIEDHQFPLSRDFVLAPVPVLGWLTAKVSVCVLYKLSPPLTTVRP